LDGSEKSLQGVIEALELFKNTAGQRANMDKTLAIWIGSKVFSSEKLLADQNLSWSHRTFKLLGINFDLNKRDITAHNYTQKLESIKKLLASWVFRPLSTIGKITVIKSLALSILVHLFMVLPDPTAEWMKELESIFFRFIWDRGKDKVKRNVMYSAYDEGGLKVPHIPSFIKSLKLIWIKKLINPLDFSPWKILIIDKLDKIGGHNIWNSSSNQLLWLAENKITNSFWKDVLLAWSYRDTKPPSSSAEVLSQILWYNSDILIDKKPVYYKKLVNSNILYINDLINNEGKFYSYQNFQAKIANTNNVVINFLEYYGILSAIPASWKAVLKQDPRKLLEIVDCRDMALLRHSFKPAKIFYWKFLDKIHIIPTSQKRWLEQINITDIEWRKFYILPFKTTSHSKLINLQFKILHRILATNKKLKTIWHKGLLTFVTFVKQKYKQ